MTPALDPDATIKRLVELREQADAIHAEQMRLSDAYIAHVTAALQAVVVDREQWKARALDAEERLLRGDKPAPTGEAWCPECDHGVISAAHGKCTSCNRNFIGSLPATTAYDKLRAAVGIVAPALLFADLTSGDRFSFAGSYAECVKEGPASWRGPHGAFSDDDVGVRPVVRRPRLP